MENRKPKISVVLPVYNEEGNVDVVYAELKKTLSSAGKGYEIIFVDDGSSDGSLERIKKLSFSDPAVRYVSLSRNFGHQNAIFAGMTEARGQAVISMDADMQHPPALISEMIKLWEEGNEIVYTTKEEYKLPPVKHFVIKTSYWFISRMSGLELRFGQSDFRLIGRKALDVLLTMPEYHKFLRGQVKWVGFRQKALPYKVEPRHSGVPKYSYETLYKLAMDGIFSFGRYPLHLVMMFNILIFFISAVYITFVFVNRILHMMGLPHVPIVLGWTTVVMSIFLLGSIQLMAIGILSEYVGRIYDQTKNRPVFIVKDKSNGEK